MTVSPWRPVSRMDFRKLREARRQAHHAVQWLARAARAYIPEKPDDSHTNLGWDASLGGLTTHSLPDRTRIGLGLADLTLTVLNADVRSQVLPLDGFTDADVRAWLVQQLTVTGTARGLVDPPPYEIPEHPVGSGGKYTTTELAEPLRMLANWYGNANAVLGAVRQQPAVQRRKPPPVRCWPHHFDLDCLLDLGRGRSTALGFSPGDEYCDEPYFYVTIYPEPRIPDLPLLPPLGHWHSHEFVAAFAPAHKVVAARDQAGETEAFFVFALDAALKALR